VSKKKLINYFFHSSL